METAALDIEQESAIPELRNRAAEYFRRAYNELATHVDRMFAWLLAAEWVGMIGIALVFSPRTWNGDTSSVNPHFLAALLAGPAFIIPAIMLALVYPSYKFTRHVIAISQMLVSSLLIDVTGGRIETHFSIFGSLAFLAFYRDWRVLVTASVLTTADHVIRGLWWPRSVYGVFTISLWRPIEHAWWVLFEDFFLILATRRSIKEMWTVAMSKASLHAGAYHDALTGLPNRRLLQERFDSRAGSGETKTRAVLFIDLDRFKQANDTLGHAVGDKVLAIVAGRLTETITKTNTIARVGGDEFVALLEEITGVADAMEVGSQLMRALAMPFRVDGHELLLSASVGISLYPEHGNTLSSLQERADRAMYVAKAQGRNQCAVFSSAVAKHEARLVEIGRDLYQAHTRGEFRVHFQPLVEKDAQLYGFEALIRWKHPVHGLVSPSDFIPMAERSGLMVPIGEWVLMEACLSCAAWNPPSLIVTVNVSAMQLDQPDFADRVFDILRESHLDPHRLTLELTENVLIKDSGSARKQLVRLRQEGVRIALDDFGTGYSSLSYLVTLPADSIKLDRSFVNRDCENAPAVIESVIQMAHRVGLKVVGEGVETRAQCDRLVDMNCDQMQGFYFSRPIPAGDVQAYIGSTYSSAAVEREAREEAVA